MTDAGQPQGRGSFFSDVLKIGLTRVAVVGMTVLTGVLIARLLGAEGRGLVAVLTVVPVIIVTASDFGVKQSAAYFIGRKVLSTETVVGSFLFVGSLATALSALICLLYFAATWSPAYSWLLVALAIAATPMIILKNYATGVFLGTQHIANFNRAHWLSPALRLLFVVAFVGLLGWGVGGVMLAQLVAGAALAAYALFLIWRLFGLRQRMNLPASRKLVGLGASYAASLFSLTLLYRVNIVLLQGLGTLAGLGIYTVGANFAEYIWQIPSIMQAVVFSRGANAKDPQVFTSKVVVLVRLTFLAALASGLFIALVSPFVIPFMYGEAFRGSIGVLIAIMPGVVAFCPVQVLQMDLEARGKAWLAACIVVPAIALNVVLGLLLIPHYGAIGAAATSSVVYCAAALVYLVLYSRVSGLRLSDVVVYRRDDFRLLFKYLPTEAVLKYIRPKR